jgi:hypothetical protein
MSSLDPIPTTLSDHLRQLGLVHTATWMIRRLTPASSKCVAYECLRGWHMRTLRDSAPLERAAEGILQTTARDRAAVVRQAVVQPPARRRREQPLRGGEVPCPNWRSGCMAASRCEPAALESRARAE